ncbi:hypothetical protein Hanom_Chr10g00877661 [Helianthus anomalus]
MVGVGCGWNREHIQDSLWYFRSTAVMRCLFCFPGIKFSTLDHGPVEWGEYHVK